MRAATKTKLPSTLRDPAELFAEAVVLAALELAVPVELLAGSVELGEEVLEGSVVEVFEEDVPLSKVTERSETGNDSVESVILIPEPFVHTEDVPGTPATNLTPAHCQLAQSIKGDILDREFRREVVQRLVLPQSDLTNSEELPMH